MRIDTVNNKTSFGTTPSIGEYSAGGLRKYHQNLTQGILDAFDTLAQNGENNKLGIQLGLKRGVTDLTIDAMDVTLSQDGKRKSAVSLNPKLLQKFSPKAIAKMLILKYEKLLNSSEIMDEVVDYPQYYKEGNLAGIKSTNIFEALAKLAKRASEPPQYPISEEHKDLIGKLANKYGFNDFTAA